MSDGPTPVVDGGECFVAEMSRRNCKIEFVDTELNGTVLLDVGAA